MAQSLGCHGHPLVTFSRQQLGRSRHIHQIVIWRKLLASGVASVTRAPLTLASEGHGRAACPCFKGAVEGSQAFKAHLRCDVFNWLLALADQARRDVLTQRVFDLEKARAFCMKPPDSCACRQVQYTGDACHVTKKFLRAKSPCADGFRWFSRHVEDGSGYQQALDTLVNAGRVGDACWLLSQSSAPPTRC